MTRITAIGVGAVFVSAITHLAMMGIHPVIIAVLSAFALVSVICTAMLGRTRHLVDRAYQRGYFDAIAGVTDDR